jgi:hypothetical protein
MNELIYKFSKNSMEEIRVAISEYKGRRYISLWVWFKNDEDNWQPGKRGLNLPLDLLGDLKKAIDTTVAKIAFEEEAKSATVADLGEQASDES